MRAFTLLELMIVIVLLGLAAALAAPSLADRDATRAQAAARLLVADLGFAQIESIARPDDLCLVRFDISTATYTLARVSAPTTPLTEPVTGGAYLTQFGAGRAAEMTGVVIHGYSLGGDDRIVFGKYGQLDQASAASVQLRSGAVIATVQIDASSGETSVTLQ